MAIKSNINLVIHSFIKVTGGCLLAYALQSHAAPTITNVTGVAAEGNSITISGSGFGIKSPANPWLFDDFSGGTHGLSMLNRLSPTGNRQWNVYSAGGSAPATSLTYDKTYYYSGPFSAYQYDATTRTTDQNIYANGQATSARYVSYQFRWTDNGSNSRVWKFDRTTSGTTNNPPYDSPPHFGWGDYAYTDNCKAFDNLGWLSKPEQNVWNRIEYHYVMSDKGVANGTVRLWLNNIIMIDKLNNWMTCSNSCGTCRIDTWMSPIIANNTNIIKTWIDDIYIDNTLARVELCEGSTIGTKGECTLFIPSAWSSSAITSTVKTGKFVNGQAVYIFVYDSSGSSNSNGYAIKIDSSSGGLVTEPKGLKLVQ